MPSVFLWLAFTHIRLVHQDHFYLCDGIQVNAEWVSVYLLLKGVRQIDASEGGIKLLSSYAHPLFYY